MYTIKSPLSQSQRGENTCTCDLHILVLHFIVDKSLTHFFLSLAIYSVQCVDQTKLNSPEKRPAGLELVHTVGK